MNLWKHVRPNNSLKQATSFCLQCSMNLLFTTHPLFSVPLPPSVFFRSVSTSLNEVVLIAVALPLRFLPPLRLVVVYREEPTQLSRLLSHGSAGLPEEPIYPAVADGLCVCGERPHHKLHPALHLHPLADQQTALPQNQLPALLLPLESWVDDT